MLSKTGIFVFLSGFYFVLSSSKLFSQTNIDYHQSSKNFIKELLLTQPDNFKPILDSSEKYRAQIIYTRINRDKKNKPHLKTFYCRYKPAEYFYPASTVKLPISMMALEKINNIKIKGLTKESLLSIDSTTCQKAVSVKQNKSIAEFIKRALIVSDNNAYNRLYEFLGRDHINWRLWKLGYKTARIVHRFSICNFEENKYTNGFTFYDTSGKTIYHQEPKKDTRNYTPPISNMKVGKFFINDSNQKVKGPKDFTNKNYLSLKQIHQIIESTIFPDLFSKKKSFNLSPEDYDFIRKQLALTPRESGIPDLADTNKYFDTYTNYLLYGADSLSKIKKGIRIFNIVGQSYGFLIDAAYIADFTNKIEFFLSAVIYTNNNQVVGDGIYEYNQIGLPYLKNLGNLFYNYELKRKRNTIPNLNEFSKLFE